MELKEVKKELFVAKVDLLALQTKYAMKDASNIFQCISIAVGYAAALNDLLKEYRQNL